MNEGAKIAICRGCYREEPTLGAGEENNSLQQDNEGRGAKS